MTASVRARLAPLLDAVRADLGPQRAAAAERDVQTDFVKEYILVRDTCHPQCSRYWARFQPDLPGVRVWFGSTGLPSVVCLPRVEYELSVLTLIAPEFRAQARQRAFIISLSHTCAS